MTTTEERAYHVRQMLSNFRLEGIEPDETDQKLLQAYIDGTTTLNDLLSHARAYADYCYRSRPADDGGTYFLSPRDDHLMPRPSTDPAEIERIRSDLEKLQLAYEAERDADRKADEPVDPDVAALVESFFRSYNPPST